MSSRTMHGRFIPQHPEKYVGNVHKIFFRSSWELSFLKRLDANPSVVRYASEEIAIPYLSPIDQRVHRYFPDFIVVYRKPDGSLAKEIIEIKPYQQSVETARMSERDRLALIVNDAKWKAANIYAASQGATFRVLTEKSLFKQGPAKKRAPTKAKMPKVAQGPKR